MSSYGNIPSPSDAHMGRGYGTSGVSDFAQQQQNPTMSSPLSQSALQHQGFDEDYDTSNRNSFVPDGALNRSASRASMSSTAVGGGVSRNNTLKKKASIRRTTSLKRSGSKKSLKAGSIRGFGDGIGDSEDFNSAFFTPVPTTGTPTEILANRFQAWRQLLKSLITYFREIQTSYETRAKALHKVQNTLTNITHPALFIGDHGLGDATRILEDYHKRSISEANKSREIENDVIGALTGLRSDLGQKIKEIKSLSGDFKNSVEKEKDNTRREVEKLQEAIQHADHEDGAATGKADPFVVRLGVDRAIEKQIDEENYLHRAYLNLESSGRELESIVVGEIQKAYNALAGILKREGDDAYNAVESLKTGPIAMPKDQEWYHFVTHDSHFVDPDLPLRRIEDIEYPGKHHPAATEIRAGMLERKSKYLKSYTPGWYVLSPTHLHEFKSADKIYSQPPVMSLYLLDQKLGSHSERGSSSHKFMLKGKQSGGMHKGHNWVFRAESFETMMAWFEDIRILTEKTGEERNAFVRKHARSVSGTTDRATISSDGIEDDEADQTPYSADVASLAEQNPPEQRPQRPQPGGRFPSDLAIRTLGSNTDGAADLSDDDEALVAGGTGAAAGVGASYAGRDPYHMRGISSGTSWQQPTEPAPATQATEQKTLTDPVQTQTYALPVQAEQPVNQQQPFLGHEPATAAPASLAPVSAAAQSTRPDTEYGEWMAPAAAGVGAGALGATAYQHHEQVKSAEPAFDQTEPATAYAQSQTPTTIERSFPTASQPIEPATAYAQNLTPAAEPPLSSVLIATEPATAYAQSLGTTASETVRPSNGIDEAAGLVGAGALGATAGAAYEHGVEAKPVEPVPVASKSGSAYLVESNTAATLSDDSLASTIQSPTSTLQAPVSGGLNNDGLGGNEREGAHLTGRIFPRVVRHDTNLSISQLHVPGEFPKRT